MKPCWDSMGILGAREVVRMEVVCGYKADVVWGFHNKSYWVV